MYKKWNLYDPVPDLPAFAESLGRDTTMAALLWHRGIRTREAAELFLHPERLPFKDPFLMQDMEKAADRIETAIKEGQSITVYGDYDVDGMTATSLLVRALRRFGANVDFYIPDRMTEGYGLNRPALEMLAAKTDLMITVDCGIASVADVAAVADKLDIVITDHHLPGKELPPALAVLNPHRADCPYPFKDLAGVGVAFKLCQALAQRLGHLNAKGEYTEDLELVALGTVADLVPLRGENRRIVKEGMARMETTAMAGIAALVDVAGLKDKKINAGHIGFLLAPRLNAAGRIESARTGVALLTASERGEADKLAFELDTLNTERRTIEHEICEAAEKELEPLDMAEEKAVVAAGKGWNPGVIGIAASRLVDKFYKPTIVLSIGEDGMCRGSCRSIEGLNMYEALTACKDYLVQFGGHAMAAGLSLREENIPAFREAFAAYAGSHLSEEDYEPKVSVEFEVMPEDLTLDFVEELSLLEPYGMGNPKPYLGCRNVRGREAAAIGREHTHLRFKLGTEENPVTGLWWNHAELAPAINREALDIVYAPAINEWNGSRSLQCMVESLSPASAERVFPEKELLRDVYRFLVTCQRQKGSIPMATAQLAADFGQMFAHISSYTMGAALRIFEELGILRENLKESCYYLPPVKGRMELEASPTYRRHKVI